MVSTENIFKNLIQTGEKYQDQIEKNLPDVLSLLPLTVDKIQKMDEVERGQIDTLVENFIKLQCLLEIEIIPQLAESMTVENTILVELEKIGVDLELWERMKTIRKNLENYHENNDVLIAQKLNECVPHCDSLLKAWLPIKTFIGMVFDMPIELTTTSKCFPPDFGAFCGF